MKVCTNPKCKCQNADNATYCKNCGRKLEKEVPSPPKNIMEAYPKMKFTPTNFYDWRKPLTSRLLTIVFSLGLFIASCFMICLIHDTFSSHHEDRVRYSGDYSCDRSGWIINVYDWYGCETQERACSLSSRKYNEKLLIGYGICITALISLSLLVLYFNKKFPKTKLYDIADYVQKYHFTGLFGTPKKKKYVFYAKDNKIGVLDYAHYNVQLPAQYEMIAWRTKNKYLNVTQKGETFIIDINGH